MDATAKLWDVETGEEVATLTVSYLFFTYYIPMPLLLFFFFSYLGSHSFINNALINFSFTPKSN